MLGSSLLLLLAWAGEPDLAPRRALSSPPPRVGPNTAALVVKWRDEARGRVGPSGTVTLEQAPPVPHGWMVAHGLWFEPWIDAPPQRLADLEARAARRSGRAQPDLAGLHRVSVRDASPERLAEVAALLAGHPAVEFVTTDDVEVPPPTDLAPETPDLVDRQVWLGAERGIDAWTAWNVWAVDGAGVRVADCEYGWHREHEDLSEASWYAEAGHTPVADVAARGWDHHGTAVAGQIVGQHNGYGVRGLAPAADFASYPEWSNEGGYRRGSSIANAIADSAPGDVVLLEMQTGGPDGRLAPAEVNPAVWTLVKTGTDAGVIVVGAAGNGAANLDAPAYEAYRGWGDSGALIVGAGSADGRRVRLGFSTYGARVDVQGWGQSVFTTGYGNFARYGGDVLQTYTAGFSGTSSASPFIAGAAALVQEAVLRYRIAPLSSVEMREILVETGLPAAPGAGIGPLPDLDAALVRVVERFDRLPEVSAVSGPEAVDEGATVVLEAEVAVVETSDAAIVWIVGDAEVEGPTLTLDARDDGVLEGIVRVTDDFGRTAERPFAVTVGNVAPGVGLPQVAGQLVEGAEIRLTAPIFDPGPDDVHAWAWTVDGEPAGDGPELRLTPSNDGPIRVGVQVSDDDGGVSAAREVVLPIADVPGVLLLDVPEAVPRKEPVTLTAWVDDPGDDVWTIAWSLDEVGEIGQGDEISYAFRGPGPWRVTARAVDQDGVEAVSTVEIGRTRGGCACDATGSGGGWLALGVGAIALRRRRRG